MTRQCSGRRGLSRASWSKRELCCGGSELTPNLKREIARASETARMKGGKEAADAARAEKAAELGLPVKAGKVEYPDAQLEYDLDGRSGRGECGDCHRTLQH